MVSAGRRADPHVCLTDHLLQPRWALDTEPRTPGLCTLGKWEQTLSWGKCAGVRGRQGAKPGRRLQGRTENQGPQAVEEDSGKMGGTKGAWEGPRVSRR